MLLIDNYYLFPTRPLPLTMCHIVISECAIIGANHRARFQIHDEKNEEKTNERFVKESI